MQNVGIGFVVRICDDDDKTFCRFPFEKCNGSPESCNVRVPYVKKGYVLLGKSDRECCQCGVCMEKGQRK